MIYYPSVYNVGYFFTDYSSWLVSRWMQRYHDIDGVCSCFHMRYRSNSTCNTGVTAAQDLRVWHTALWIDVL